MLALIGSGESESSKCHLPSSGVKRKHQVAAPFGRLPQTGTPQHPVAEYHPEGQEKGLGLELAGRERYGFYDRP